MDIISFDKDVAATTDTLIENMRFELTVYSKRMNELIAEAEKQKLPEHLVMASVHAHVTRMNAANEQTARDLA